jgi:hypothetical protein
MEQDYTAFSTTTAPVSTMYPRICAPMRNGLDEYLTVCSSTGHRAICQERILSIERSNNIGLYNLNTIGATAMVTQDDSDIAWYDQNVNAFQDTIAKFKSN